MRDKPSRDSDPAALTKRRRICASFALRKMDAQEVVTHELEILLRFAGEGRCRIGDCVS